MRRPVRQQPFTEIRPPFRTMSGCVVRCVSIGFVERCRNSSFTKAQELVSVSAADTMRDRG